ncbi:MAG: von Willebrand factor type A domain-containing protein, partial [Gammaproteobacteria bacterium]|nr:von Willebrand factor type A domain-containing protein [Gammaproteobacteria bacterium]
MSGMMTSPQYNDYSHTFLNIQDNEKYANYKSNSVKQTSLEPVSTFSIDVDTGSYSNIRRLINSGTLPVKDAVRVEEMLNYFQYSYANSSDNVGAPFITHTETAPNPWSKGHHLLQIGIKAIDVAEKNLPAANLVFLIDVSGSMSSANKLGLLKKSLALMITKMRKQDKVSLVVYAGASGVVLKPTNGNQKSTIINALSQLKSGGSTNGASGIRLAYQVAQQAYIKNGINRIMLATDGDFNVGTTNFEQLLNLVQEKRKTGISLSTLGFGTGNYNDQLMEQLADAANGKYSYIDTLKEAQKVLIDEMSSTLKTVAKDVKIQVEFNPSTISEYRLI